MSVGVVAPWGKFTGLDNDGNPAASGYLYTYAAGTTTAIATYSNVGLTTANTNPVLLDASGRATVYLNPASAYKFILTSAAGVTLWEQDNITVAAAEAAVTQILGGTGITITSTGGHGTAIVTVTANGIFTGDIITAATKRVYFDGGADTYIVESASNTLNVTVGATDLMDVTTASVDIKKDLTIAVGESIYLDGRGGSAALSSNSTHRIACVPGTNGMELAAGATAWSSLSDERAKVLLENINNATDKVAALRAVIGRFASDPESTRRAMLIAQDVQKVLPEAVHEEDGMLHLAYTDVIPLLVAAIHELTDRVAALEPRIR